MSRFDASRPNPDAERDRPAHRAGWAVSAAWLVAAVGGAAVSGLSRLTRASCPPGWYRLIDVTSVLPYLFAFSAIGAVVMLLVLARRSSGRMLLAISSASMLLTLGLVVVSVAVAAGDRSAEGNCWTF